MYNKEKGQRGGPKRAVRKIDSRSSLKSGDRTSDKISEIVPPTPELPHQSRISGSMAEDEQFFGAKMRTSRSRQSSVTNSSPPVTAAATRLRSQSASMPPAERFSHATRNTSKISAIGPPLPPSSAPQTPQRDMQFKQPPSLSGMPPRKRTVVRNRESLDLDDVIGERSEDDAVVDVAPKSPSTRYPVSAGARDLIDFLATGPPDMPERPASTSVVTLETPKAKGGRLQRMISKLTLKDGEQKHSRSNNGSAESSSKRTSPVTQAPLSPLYNKPVPPRPPPSVPTPISPPSSPSQTSLVDAPPPSTRPRNTSNARKAVPSSWDQNFSVPESSIVTAAPKLVQAPTSSQSPQINRTSPRSSPVNGQTNGQTNGQPKPIQVKEEDKPRSSSTRSPKHSHSSANGSVSKPVIIVPERTTSKKLSEVVKSAEIPTAPSPAPSPPSFSSHAQEMRRLIGYATNVDECRLIVDMFLAKSGLHLEPADPQNPYPSPPSDLLQLPSGSNADLEHSLVELFLGGMGDEGDEELSSPAESSDSKSSPVTFPVSPPDTPIPVDSNGITTTEEPVVVNDTQAPAAVEVVA